MSAQEPTSAPEPFLRLLKKTLAGSGLSLRETAKKAGISPAYLSRVLNGERGLPGDDTITQLEQVLDVQPRGRLFDAAKRHDSVVTKVIKKDPERLLMRSLEPLTEEEFAQVLSLAQRIARKYHRDGK